MRTIQYERNLSQLTQARSLQAFANANRGKDTPAYEDLAPFLPHPAAWQQQSVNRTLRINRQTAIAVLQSRAWLDSNVLAALDPWLNEIEMIAQGD